VPYDFGDRPRAPYVGDERAVLDGWLNFHRATLLWKCEGLTLDQLKLAPVPTTKLTLLGLVRHLTEVERGWFLPFLGEEVPDLYCSKDNPDGDFDDVADADAAGDLARYGEVVDAISELLEHRGLDEVEVDGEKSFNLRWIMTHLIEEYARHNGHADLLREAIDGRTGE
jgi:uncharacterized damage-inducible protein DinB